MAGIAWLLNPVPPSGLPGPPAVSTIQSAPSERVTVQHERLPDLTPSQVQPMVPAATACPLLATPTAPSPETTGPASSMTLWAPDLPTHAQ